MAVLLGLCLGCHLLGLSAHAAPLVHAGDADAAHATADRLVGAAERQPVALAELLQRPPVRLSGAGLETCAGTPEPLPGDPAKPLRQAIVYGQYAEVEGHLAGARGQVLCHRGTLQVDAVAQLSFLGGVGAALGGDDARALARFREALALDPALQWDPTYPAEHARLLDAARAGVATVELEVVPPGTGIDGRVGSAEVAAGVAHWVTGGGQTVRLVTDFRDTVVVPAGFPPNALDWADDDGRRADLSALLAATLGEGEAVDVVVGDHVWSGIAGRTDWIVTRPDAAADPTPVATARRPLPPVLIGVGAAAALTGGALVAEGYATGAARAEAAGTNAADFDALRDQHDAARSRYTAGYGVLGAGAAAAGLGLVLTFAASGGTP